MVEAQRDREVNEESHGFYTTREACDLLCYASPASFRRAWRRAGLDLLPQLTSGRWLVRVEDVEKFVGSSAAQR